MELHFNSFMKIIPISRHYRPHRNKCFNCRRFGQSVIDMLNDSIIPTAIIAFISAALLRYIRSFLVSKMRCRNNYSANFMQSHNGEPKFEPAFQTCHYNVTFPNAEALKICRRLVGIFFISPKVNFAAFTLIVRPKAKHVYSVPFRPRHQQCRIQN